MFDAAREGNSELVLAAVNAGLPSNLTNDKGLAPLITPAELVELTRLAYIP